MSLLAQLFKYIKMSTACRYEYNIIIPRKHTQSLNYNVSQKNRPIRFSEILSQMVGNF